MTTSEQRNPSRSCAPATGRLRKEAALAAQHGMIEQVDRLSSENDQCIVSATAQPMDGWLQREEPKR